MISQFWKKFNWKNDVSQFYSRQTGIIFLFFHDYVPIGYILFLSTFVK